MKRRRASLKTVLKNWGRALTFRKRGLHDAIASTASFVGLVNGGGYQSLDPNRKIISGLVRRLKQYSANELADLSLPQLRALCRQLERDNATARAAVEGAVAQIVGTGISLWPDTGDQKLDDLIGEAFAEWCEDCDISGKRNMFDLQAEAMRSWFVAGEHLWRVVIDPERLQDDKLPIAILPLESEWIYSDQQTPAERTELSGITNVSGINLDQFGRPVSYVLINPDFVLEKQPEIVPAKELIHGYEHRRALQNRGEPWLAPVVERIHQEGDLIDTELKAAINASGIAVVVTSEYHQAPDDGTDTDQLTDGTAEDPAVAIGVGSVARLYPGEDAKAFSHDRPGQQIAPFTEMLRGSIAGACRVSRRWLDRNYAGASFSALRADEQDSRRLLTPVIELFGRSTIGSAYRAALPYICAKLGIDVPKKKTYRLLPDGVPYVNPKDDIQAASLAIAAGLSTHEEEIAKRGGDIRKVWTRLAKEQEFAKSLGLVVDLGNKQPQPMQAEQPEKEEVEQEEDEKEDDMEDENEDINEEL